MAARFVPAFIYMLGGLIIWAARFLFAYAFTGLACARAWDGELVQIALGVASLIALLGCAALIAYAYSKLRGATGASTENLRFMHWVAALAAGLGIIAIVWETLPVLFVPICT